MFFWPILQLPCPPYRNDYRQCLYPECLTNPEEKLDSLSNWSKISCGLEQKVRLQAYLFKNSPQRKDQNFIMACVFSSTERTEKVPMGSIKNVVSEPIEGHEDYHMMVTVVCYLNVSVSLKIPNAQRPRQVFISLSEALKVKAVWYLFEEKQRNRAAQFS